MAASPGINCRDNFNLTGELFSLPAIDPVLGTCLTFTDACTSPSSGELNASRVLAELFAPINAPLARSLNLSLGSRYSDYSAFGDTVNSKIGIEWRPVWRVRFAQPLALDVAVNDPALGMERPMNGWDPCWTDSGAVHAGGLLGISRCSGCRRRCR